MIDILLNTPISQLLTVAAIACAAVGLLCIAAGLFFLWRSKCAF